MYRRIHVFFMRPVRTFLIEKNYFLKNDSLYRSFFDQNDGFIHPSCFNRNLKENIVNKEFI